MLRAAGVAPAALDAHRVRRAGPAASPACASAWPSAKGLALPTGVPLLVVSSLEALALDILGAPPSGNVSATAVPCLDAGKGEVYVAAYAPDRERMVREVAACARLAPAALTSWLAALDRPLVAGNGAVRYPDAWGGLRPAEVAGPTAISVGRLALGQRERGEAADLATAVPFYGRPPDITVKRRA